MGGGLSYQIIDYFQASENTVLIVLATAVGPVGVIGVTGKMAGQSLRELDIRHQFGLNVVAIRNQRYAEGAGDSDVTDPERRLRRTDTLIVTGTSEDIERMGRELT